MQQSVSVEQQSVLPSRVEDGLYLPAGASLFTRVRVAVKAFRALEKVQDDPIAGGLLNASLDGDRFRRHAHAWPRARTGSGC